MQSKFRFWRTASYIQRFPARAWGLAALPGQLAVAAVPDAMKLAAAADGGVARGDWKVIVAKKWLPTPVAGVKMP